MAAPTPLPSLHTRTAIVIGASRGIGKEIALHLASNGFNLLINHSSPNTSTQADSIAAQINSSSSDDPSRPSRAVTFQADVTDPNQIKALFDKAEVEFGEGVSVVVNCAGVLDSKYNSVAETSVEDFDRTFSVNTRGAFICCKEAANRVIRGGGGRIIMLSSSMVGGLMPGYGAYAASKAAVETMVRIMAKELRGTGITVNCVAPGPIATEMFYEGKTEEQIQRLIDACPMGRLGQPRDVAPIVGFLSSDASEWVNGQVIRANGGYV